MCIGLNWGGGEIKNKLWCSNDGKTQSNETSCCARTLLPTPTPILSSRYRHLTSLCLPWRFSLIRFEFAIRFSRSTRAYLRGVLFGFFDRTRKVYRYFFFFTKIDGNGRRLVDRQSLDRRHASISQIFQTLIASHVLRSDIT